MTHGEIADKLTRQLMQDLHSGKLKSVGMTQIEEAIRAEVRSAVPGTREFNTLANMVCRRVVNFTMKGSVL